MFLQIKDRKHIEQNFHSGIMHQGWDLGVLGGSKTVAGIRNGTPLTGRSSYNFTLIKFWLSKPVEVPHLA